MTRHETPNEAGSPIATIFGVITGLALVAAVDGPLSWGTLLLDAVVISLVYKALDFFFDRRDRRTNAKL